MTAVVLLGTCAANVALHVRRSAAWAGRSLCAAILARATRRALNGLPDDLLEDIGLTRSDIPFVVDTIAGADAQARRSSGLRLALVAVIAVSACVVASHVVLAQDAQVKRGQSLPPVGNKLPGPFGPNETPTSFVMKIVPPQTAAAAGPVPK